MSEDGARIDARFDDDEPFRDTPEAGGISLESALRDFGPAALDDLIARVRVLAQSLDAAHRRGVVHGALNPSKIIITDESTSIITGKSSVAPYVAPEVASGQAPSAASDLFSLAAITYEWLFGKRIDGPAHRTMVVRTMPGVDRAALAKAFSRALAPTPEVRFATCTDFCDALAAAAVPELPLVMGGESEPDHDVDPVGPFVPEAPAEPELAVAHGADTAPVRDQDDIKDVDDFKIVADATPQPARSYEEAPVASWNPPVAASRDTARFGGAALIVAALVGAVFGFAGGYMARPRALQSAPAETFAPQPAVDAPVATPAAPVERTPAAAAPNVPAADASKETAPATTPPAPVAKSRRATPARSEAAPRPKAPVVVRSPAAATTGGLDVDSRPVGASVTINGRPSGNTPLAINDLAPGDYRIVMTLPGYRNFAATVRVVAGERARAAYSLTAQEQE